MTVTESPPSPSVHSRERILRLSYLYPQPEGKMLLTVLHGPGPSDGNGRRMPRLPEGAVRHSGRPGHHSPRPFSSEAGRGPSAADDGSERFVGYGCGPLGAVRHSCPSQQYNEGTKMSNELSYAVLRPTGAPNEHENERVLMIVERRRSRSRRFGTAPPRCVGGGPCRGRRRPDVAPLPPLSGRDGSLRPHRAL